MSYRIIKLPIGHAVVEVEDDIDGTVLSYDESPVILVADIKEELLQMLENISQDIEKYPPISRGKYRFDSDDNYFYAEEDEVTPVDEFFK